MAVKQAIAGYHCAEKLAEGRDRYKVLLVYPSVGSEARNVSVYPPLSVLHLAGYLKDYSVAIFDQRVDDIERFRALLWERPICVGFSVMTGVQIKHSLELAAMAKEMNIPTVFGGVHPSIFPEQTQSHELVDYVVTGEGEVAYRELVESLREGRKAAPVTRNERVDLNKMPELPYELIDIEKYVHTAVLGGRALPIVFSRGCPFACTFCCNPVISKRRWRTMDVDITLRRLHQMVDSYNLDGVIFWDENLTVDPRLLNTLAKGINGKVKWFAQSRVNTLLNYDLKFLEKMGLARVSCGIESGSPKILKKIKKEEDVEEYIEVNRRLAGTSISVWYNYIVGFPDETLEDLKMTIRLAMRILDENPGADNNVFYILVPYPGTEIASSFVKSSMLPGTFGEWADFGRHNFSAAWHSPEMTKLYERIYFSSKFVGRRLSRLFPDDTDLKELSLTMSDKWRAFDFYDDREWKELIEKGWRVLRKLFGESAY